MSLNPLLFWKENASSYAILSQLALLFLCMSAGSVPVESMFYLTGLIYNSRRSSLSPDKLFEEVYCNYFSSVISCWIGPKNLCVFSCASVTLKHILQFCSIIVQPRLSLPGAVDKTVYCDIIKLPWRSIIFLHVHAQTYWTRVVPIFSCWLCSTYYVHDISECDGLH